jgi:dihydroorotase
VAHTELVQGGVLTLPELVARMSTLPARVFGLAGGTLQPGAVADVCVLDPQARWTVDPARFFTKCRNTPFAGRELVGRPTLTLVAGKIVHEASL